MAQVRLLGALGYGIISLLVVTNVDGAGDYLKELGRTTVHFLSRGKDRLTGSAGSPDDFFSLNSKLDRIAALHNRETVHIHSNSGNGSSGWFYTIVGGTLGTLLIVHITGLFDLSGFMYVTQAKFKTATEQLEVSVKEVAGSLSKARVELLSKLGVVERNLETTKKELKSQIQTTGEEIKSDVKSLSTEMQVLNGSVNNLETRLDGIHGGVGDLREQIEYANRGITLLVTVVQESLYGKNVSSQNKDEKMFLDLKSFTSQPPVVKQLKFEGPIMRLISKRELSGADRGGGGDPMTAFLKSFDLTSTAATAAAAGEE